MKRRIVNTILTGLCTALLVFLLCDAGITSWFVISLHPFSSPVTFKSIIYIFIHYGLRLSVPAPAAYLLIYAIYMTIKLHWVFYLLAAVILVCTFYATIWYLTWNLAASLLGNDLFQQ